MRSRTLLALFLGAGVASLVLAQTPESKQSASPTSNQYRIRIAEPLEGSTVTGRTVSIVIVDPPPVPAGTSVNPEERKDALRPTFQIWVDGKDHGNLPANQNVFTATDLAPGPHTIVVAAKNNAGELIDRKELRFSTVESTASAPAPAPPAPAPAPPAMTAESAPAPPAPSEPVARETQTRDASESETLPTTATAYPVATLGGLALVALGLALRGRSRR